MVVNMNLDKGGVCNQDENAATRRGGERRAVSNAEVIVVHDSDSEDEFSSGSLDQQVLEHEDQTLHTITDSPVINASDGENDEEDLGDDDDDDDDDDDAAEASDEEIPRPLTPPRLRNVPVNLPVLFDLETTGLETTSHILQIAASSPSNSFCRYVRPKKKIDFMAQLVHGLSFDGQSLFLRGEPVDAVNIFQALSDFLEFLGDGPVTLFGHNSKRFDCPILLHAVKACNLLPEYEKTISGFVDTLPLFRDVCRGLTSYRQTALYEHFFHESYTAHEAMNDVKALKKLLEMPCVTPDAFSRHSFSFDYILQVNRRSLQEQKMLPSWYPMMRAGSVKEHMAKRAAGSGLGVHHLRLAYREDGEEGVQNVLKHPNSEGKPRVTKTKRVLKQISSYIAQNPIEDNFVKLREGGSGETEDYIDGDEGQHEYDNDCDFVGDDDGDEGQHKYDDDVDLVGDDDGDEGHQEYDNDRDLVGDEGRSEYDKDYDRLGDEEHHDDDDDDDEEEEEEEEGVEEEEHHEYDNDRDTVGDDDGDEGHQESENDRDTVGDDDGDEGHQESENDRDAVGDDDGDEGHQESENDRDTVGDDVDEGHYEYDKDRGFVGDDGDRRRVGDSDGHHYIFHRPRDEREENSDNSSNDDEYPSRRKYPKISHQEEKETLGKNTFGSNCSIA